MGLAYISPVSPHEVDVAAWTAAYLAPQAAGGGGCKLVAPASVKDSAWPYGYVEGEPNDRT